MNLFTNGMEVFGEFGTFPMPNFSDDTFLEFYGLFHAGEPQIDAKNYLQKGEKILTLLRKKKHKSVFSKDDVMEMVKKRWDLTLSCVSKKVAAQFEDTFIKMTNEDPDNEECILDACSWLMNQLPKHLFVCPEYRERERHLINALCNEQQSAVINLRYQEEDMILPVGATFRARFEGAAKIRGDKGRFLNVRNFRKQISEMYLRKYVLDKFKSLKEQAKSNEEYHNLRLIGSILAEYQLLNEEKFDSLKALKGRTKGQIGLIVLFPETCEAEISILELDTYSLFKILSGFSKDYLRKKEEAKMERVLSGDYARSFQTKKNIPGKCIEAMAKSGFNRYFGYVEFDEECDLSLMEELFLEYDAFAKELSLAPFPEVSLRFRKLGNHKASGLYYYTLKCLCVDVRFPGAFVHEIGHAIDYHLDHISDKFAFSKVAERYETLLKEYIRKGKKDEVAVLKGKTKYNLQYYLMPTEIFARCFEMYVVRVRNIDNSLCKPEYGFAYPEDEKLMELIVKFFDEIFEENLKNNRE